jgi:hypothetical protein
VLEASHPLAHRDPDRKGHLMALEVRVVRVHVDDAIRLAGHTDRIDPERWRPLIMNFCQFFGLGDKLHHSTLGEIPESAYRPKNRAAMESQRATTASIRPYGSRVATKTSFGFSKPKGARSTSR